MEKPAHSQDSKALDEAVQRGYEVSSRFSKPECYKELTNLVSK